MHNKKSISSILNSSPIFHQLVNEAISAVKDKNGNVVVGTQVQPTSQTAQSQPTSPTQAQKIVTPYDQGMAAKKSNQPKNNPYGDTAKGDEWISGYEAAENANKPQTTQTQPQQNQNTSTQQNNQQQPVKENSDFTNISLESLEEAIEDYDSHVEDRDQMATLNILQELLEQVKNGDEDSKQQLVDALKELGYNNLSQKNINEWMQPDSYQRDPNNVEQEKVSWEQMGYIAQDYNAIYNTPIILFKKNLEYSIIARYLVQRIASAVGIPGFNTSENIEALNEFLNENPDSIFEAQFDNQYLNVFFSFQIKNFNGWTVKAEGAFVYKINGELCNIKIKANVSKVPKVEKPFDNSLSTFKKEVGDNINGKPAAKAFIAKPIQKNSKDIKQPK